MEIVEVLNRLQEPFVVIGVVSDLELKDEALLRKKTGVKFPLVSNSKYKMYIPRYSPAIVGTSQKGEIFFVMPGVPGEKEYIENFLYGLYYKLLPYLQKKNSLH